MPVSCSFRKRVDVEVRRRIVNRTGGRGFHRVSSGCDGVGRAAAARGRGRDRHRRVGVDVHDSKTRNGGRSANVRVSSGIETL